MTYYSEIYPIDYYQNDFNSTAIYRAAIENPEAAAYIAAVDMGLLSDYRDKEIFKDLTFDRSMERADIRRHATERYHDQTDITKSEIDANMQIRMTQLKTDSEIEIARDKGRTELQIAVDNNQSKTDRERIIQTTSESLEQIKANGLREAEELKYRLGANRINAEISIQKYKETCFLEAKRIEAEMTQIAGLKDIKVEEIKTDGIITTEEIRNKTTIRCKEIDKEIEKIRTERDVHIKDIQVRGELYKESVSKLADRVRSGGRTKIRDKHENVIGSIEIEIW